MGRVGVKLFSEKLFMGRAGVFLFMNENVYPSKVLKGLSGGFIFNNCVAI